MSSDLSHGPTRRALILGVLALSGCGFAPVYGPGGGAAALRGAVELDLPDDADGFRLRLALENRLGPVTAPRYRLAVSAAVSTETSAVNADSRSTRVRLSGTADFRLTDAADATVSSGQVSSFTAYESTSTTVATRAAEDDARDRLMTILADLITTRLLADTATGG